MNPNKENIDPNVQDVQNKTISVSGLIFDTKRIKYDFALDAACPRKCSFLEEVREFEKMLESLCEDEKTHKLVSTKNEGHDAEELPGESSDGCAGVDGVKVRCVIMPLPNKECDKDQAVYDKVFPPGPHPEVVTVHITKQGRDAVLMRRSHEKAMFADVLYGDVGWSRDDLMHNTYALFIPLKAVKMCLVLHCEHPMKKFLLRYANIVRSGELEDQVVEDSHYYKIWASNGLNKCQCRLSISKYKVLFPEAMFPNLYPQDIVQGWFKGTKCRNAAKRKETDAEFMLIDEKRIHSFEDDLVPRHILDHVLGLWHYIFDEFATACIDFVSLFGTMLMEERFEKDFSSLLQTKTRKDVVEWMEQNALAIVMENNVEKDPRFVDMLKVLN